MFTLLHCKKGLVILTIVFLTRIATVDMVLWDDTRIVTASYGQYTWSSYRNNLMLLELGVYLDLR